MLSRFACCLANPKVLFQDDVSDWAGAENMINQTVEEFGDINVLICNAGILRDRTMLNMSESEWDLIFQVHCKGSFAPAHFAGNYWKNKSKETGQPQDARVIFTTSQVGIFGNYGQSNYAAAKAANAMFAMTLAGELDRYGVTVNAVCPSGITRMTEDLRPDFGSEELALEKEKMARQHVTNEYVEGSPNNVAPLIAWLVSPDGADVTGRASTPTHSPTDNIRSPNPSASPRGRRRKAKTGRMMRSARR